MNGKSEEKNIEELPNSNDILETTPTHQNHFGKGSLWFNQNSLTKKKQKKKEKNSVPLNKYQSRKKKKAFI